MRLMFVLSNGERRLPGRASMALVERDGVVSHRLGVTVVEPMEGDLVVPVRADGGILQPRCNGQALDVVMGQLPSAGHLPGELPTAGTWVIYLRDPAGWRKAGALEIWSDPGCPSCIHRLATADGRLQPIERAVRFPDDIAFMDLTDPRAWRRVGELARARQQAAEAAAVDWRQRLGLPQAMFGGAGDDGCDESVARDIHSHPRREYQRA